MSSPPPPEDHWSGVDYRRVIAWPARIRREAPLLLRVFSGAPGKALLDLGCGTGEHARFLSANGFDVTGVDSSPTQVAAARDGEAGPRFVTGSLEEIGGLVPAGFGGALCLGNTLPHLGEGAPLRRFLEGLASRLLPGASFLVQILGYDRILSRGERTLPTNFGPGDGPGEETVLVRLMTHGPDGGVVFTPATLKYRPHGDPPLALVSSRNVPLRAWKRAELLPLLAAASLPVEETWGGMQAEPWTGESPDLVLLCRRSAG